MKPIRLMLAILFLTSLAAAQQIKSGESLVRAMHDRYASTWYRTVTFTQKSTTYKPDGTYGAALGDQFLRHAEKARLAFVRVGDDPAPQDRRGSRDVGDGRRYLASGTRLRAGEAEAAIEKDAKELLPRLRDSPRPFLGPS